MKIRKIFLILLAGFWSLAAEAFELRINESHLDSDTRAVLQDAIYQATNLLPATVKASLIQTIKVELSSKLPKETLGVTSRFSFYKRNTITLNRNLIKNKNLYELGSGLELCLPIPFGKSGPRLPSRVSSL